MSDEPRFVAETKKHIPAESKSILPSLNSFKQMKQVAPTIPTINLSSMDAAQLKNNLQRLLNDKSLTENTFIFTSRRYNKKLELERDRVEILLGIIDRVIETNRNIINYNVDVFLTQQRLEYIAFRHSVDIEREARAILREEELLARQHSDNLDKVEEESELRRQQIRAVKLANDKAEVELKVAEIRKEILAFIKNNINPADLKTHHKARLMEIAINPQGIQMMDLETLEEVKGIILDGQRSEVRKSNAAAKREEIKADHEDLKFQREKDKPRGV